MTIIDVSTGDRIQVNVMPVENADYKFLTSQRYFFNWKEERGYEVYKLVIKDTNDILGLISIERIPQEWRIHIRLLTVSKENRGRAKKYERIAGNLIAHVAKIAVELFGEMACISLKPKTTIRQYYIDTYNMKLTGKVLSLEVPELLNLINQYDHE